MESILGTLRSLVRRKEKPRSPESEIAEQIDKTLKTAGSYRGPSTTLGLEIIDGKIVSDDEHNIRTTSGDFGKSHLMLIRGPRHQTSLYGPDTISIRLADSDLGLTMTLDYFSSSAASRAGESFSAGPVIWIRELKPTDPTHAMSVAYAKDAQGNLQKFDVISATRPDLLAKARQTHDAPEINLRHQLAFPIPTGPNDYSLLSGGLQTMESSILSASTKHEKTKQLPSNLPQNKIN